MTSVSAWGRCRLNKKRADLKTFIMTQWGEHPIAAPKSERWWWWWIFWWPSARVRCLQLLPACFFFPSFLLCFFSPSSLQPGTVCVPKASEGEIVKWGQLLTISAVANFYFQVFNIFFRARAADFAPNYIHRRFISIPNLMGLLWWWRGVVAVDM